MDDEPVEDEIPGLAWRYERLAGQGLDDEAITERLASEVDPAELASAGGRGLRSSLAAAVEALRDRQLVRELGSHTVPVPWLALHVPRGGSASLSLGSSGAEHAALSVKLAGAGFGRVRSVSWKRGLQVPKRETCLRCLLHVEVIVRVYAVKTVLGAREEAHADVVGTRRELASWPDCPHCRVGVDEVDEFDFEYESVLDQRGLDTPVIETESATVESEYSAEATFGAPQVPGLGSLALGLSIKRSFNATLETMVELAPGWRYLPYWPAEGGLRQLPYWARS